MLAYKIQTLIKMMPGRKWVEKKNFTNCWFVLILASSKIHFSRQSVKSFDNLILS